MSNPSRSTPTKITIRLLAVLCSRIWLIIAVVDSCRDYGWAGYRRGDQLIAVVDSCRDYGWAGYRGGGQLAQRC
jgi:hypothetical protein